MIHTDATFFGSRVGALVVWKLNFLLFSAFSQSGSAWAAVGSCQGADGSGVGRKFLGARGLDGVPIAGALLNRNQENWNLFYSFLKLFFLFTSAGTAVVSVSLGFCKYLLMEHQWFFCLNYSLSTTYQMYHCYHSFHQNTIVNTVTIYSVETVLTIKSQ